MHIFSNNTKDCERKTEREKEIARARDHKTYYKIN